MSTMEANKLVAHRLAAEVFSLGDMASFDELVSEAYVHHNIPVPGIPGTKAGFRQLVEATRRAFPDVTVHVQDVVSEGDLVVFHDYVTATSIGEFLGVPPNGKSLEWTEIHFLRIAGQQIVEHWTNFDQLGILRQLGAVPSEPEQSPASVGTAQLVVIATATAKPGSESKLEQALRDVAGPTRAQPGCLRWELFRSVADPAQLTALEYWASEQDHEQHLKGDHVRRLIDQFEALVAGPPQIVPMVPV
jgi:steroid delta-isomerase-like uncharacterized protein